MNTGFRLERPPCLRYRPQPTASQPIPHAQMPISARSRNHCRRRQTPDLTVFASYRKIDATLNDDGDIRTILKTGYHRTPSEMQRKAQCVAVGHGWQPAMAQQRVSQGRQPYTRRSTKASVPTIHTFSDATIHTANTSGMPASTTAICHRTNINGRDSHQQRQCRCRAQQHLHLGFCQTSLPRQYSVSTRLGTYSLFSSSFSDGGSIQNEPESTPE